MNGAQMGSFYEGPGPIATGNESNTTTFSEIILSKDANLRPARLSFFLSFLGGEDPT